MYGAMGPSLVLCPDRSKFGIAKWRNNCGDVELGYRCGPGVGLQSSDTADLSSKTTFADCSRIGVWDESEECLVVVQA